MQDRAGVGACARAASKSLSREFDLMPFVRSFGGLRSFRTARFSSKNSHMVRGADFFGRQFQCSHYKFDLISQGPPGFDLKSDLNYVAQLGHQSSVGPTYTLIIRLFRQAQSILQTLSTENESHSEEEEYWEKGGIKGGSMAP